MKYQREQYFRRQQERKRGQIGLFRRYRRGELPDIQIAFNDVLGPLLGLVKTDQYIATEILIELFTGIYKDMDDEDTKDNI